ncbi:hypothetical protein NDU88_005415 [Pleurodeles waltl]|uniref:Rieske domain-containing protein n=1 Tax=Pleurodeles waltl TaxID=8319 RepID=A0AAV7VMQ5_PLEWA|nr:hypothetical protein NDU88_005415 [Pleurodeles waltl]
MEERVERRAQVLLSISAEEEINFKDGINFVRSKEDGKNYIIYKDGDKMRACKNLCKHRGGLFIKDIEDLSSRSVRCTKHNWKLDVSTMKYTNPPESICQDELVIERGEGAGLSLVERNPPNPWDADPKDPEALAFEEVQVSSTCDKMNFFPLQKPA